MGMYLNPGNMVFDGILNGDQPAGRTDQGFQTASCLHSQYLTLMSEKYRLF